MAASRLGGSVLQYYGYFSSSPCNRNPVPGLLFFFRGFASTLFVKDISFSTTEEGLANSFSQFGKVVEGLFAPVDPSFNSSFFLLMVPICLAIFLFQLR
ncbi:hypothetical protein REPUB_Repub05bG0144900 [Reevesia pubescens]